MKKQTVKMAPGILSAVGSPKWEYKVVGVPHLNSDFELNLNELGTESWELIAVTGGAAYLKRWKSSVSPSPL